MTCINCGKIYRNGSKNHRRVFKNNKCINCGASPNIYLNKKMLLKEYSEQEITALEERFGATVK